MPVCLAPVGDESRLGHQPAHSPRNEASGNVVGMPTRSARPVKSERWFKTRRIGLRAGVSASTAGEARPAASGGASVAVGSGFWVEARGTRGGEDAERGWSVAAHVMF